MPPTIRILWKIFYDFSRKFLTTTSSLRHGTEVGSAPPTMSTGLQSIQWLRRKKSWTFARDRDDSLVMVDVNGGGGRVMVPGNIMRDPRVFRLNINLWIFELLLQLKFSLSAGSSSPQTSSTSCWPSDPRGCSGTPSLLSTTSTTLPPAGRSHSFFIWNATLKCIDNAEAKHGCR